MLMQYAPGYAEAVFVAGAGSQGDGLRMGLALGADLRGMDYVKEPSANTRPMKPTTTAAAGGLPSAIAVNQDGQRCVDEHFLQAGRCGHGPALLHQIMDQGISTRRG